MTNLNAPYTLRIDRSEKPLERLTPDDLYAGMPSKSRQASAAARLPGRPAKGAYARSRRVDLRQAAIATVHRK
jgi:hypothetical protein